MTLEKNKAIVRHFFEEVWNQQKLEMIDEVFAATVLTNGQQVARDAIKQLVTARRASFPDIRVTVEDQVAEGDKVSTRRSWQATHQGPYRGIAGTGKRVTWLNKSASCASLMERSWRIGRCPTNSASYKSGPLCHVAARDGLAGPCRVGQCSVEPPRPPQPLPFSQEPR